MTKGAQVDDSHVVKAAVMERAGDVEDQTPDITTPEKKHAMGFKLPGTPPPKDPELGPMQGLMQILSLASDLRRDRPDPYNIDSWASDTEKTSISGRPAIPNSATFPTPDVQIRDVDFDSTLAQERVLEV